MEHSLKKEAKQTLLQSLENGCTVSAACKAAGAGRTTFYRWRQDDALFARKVEEVQNLAVAAVEDALYETALKGNVTAQIFFLCNRAPERWHNVNRIVHTGAGGAPIKHEIVNLTDKELEDALAAELAKINSGAAGAATAAGAHESGGEET